MSARPSSRSSIRSTGSAGRCSTLSTSSSSSRRSVPASPSVAPSPSNTAGLREARSAVRDADLKSLKALLTKNPAIVHAQDVHGMYLLHHAVVSGSPDVVHALLNAGADPGCTDKHGNTPLHRAFGAGKRALPAVDVLIEGGAPTDVKNVHGQLPFERLPDESLREEYRARAEAAARAIKRQQRRSEWENNPPIALKDGKIAALVRIRPLLASEGGTPATSCTGRRRVQVSSTGPKSATDGSQAATDVDAEYVFEPETSQAQVWDCLFGVFDTMWRDGVPVCVMAYGQTGAGKTFTMEGSSGNPGVMFRALEEIFELCADRDRGDGNPRAGADACRVSVSLIEIYNNELTDLLVDGASAARLETREHPKWGHIVHGARDVPVESAASAYNMVAPAMRRRREADTRANERSSRSHVVLDVHVNRGLDGPVRAQLVDLAGSERTARMDSSATRRTETAHINKSLSALGDCIGALASGNKHVPWRNSRLTQLLQDFLAPGARCALLACASPAERDAAETLSTLRFVERVRAVDLAARARGPITSLSPLDRARAEITSLKAVIAERDAEIDELRARIHQLEASSPAGKSKRTVSKR